MQGVMPVLVFPATLCESLERRLPAKFEWIAAHSVADCIDAAASRRPKLLIVRHEENTDTLETLCTEWQDNDEELDARMSIVIPSMPLIDCLPMAVDLARLN